MKKEIQEQLLGVVKKNYEEIAEEFSSTRKDLHWSELEKLTKDVKDGSSVLDVGCGSGRLLNYFKDKKIDYLGVDNSPGLIKIAQERFPEFKFQLADNLQLEKLAKNDFDYVYSIAVLHHLPGKETQIKALRQMSEKIKTDGRIILSVWNLWQTKYLFVIIKSAVLKILGQNKADFGDILFNWNKGGIISQRYYHAFTMGELRSLCHRAGLIVNKAYKDKHNYYLILGR